MYQIQNNDGRPLTCRYEKLKDYSQSSQVQAEDLRILDFNLLDGKDEPMVTEIG